MQFLIADTFTDSLARLTEDERKAAKITAVDLQLDPTSPGLSFHRIDKSKDKNFWSLRVNRDLRLIVHRLADRVLLCFVGHHDAAYSWAERRRLETHPTTGAAQLVEVRETVVEVPIPKYVEVAAPAAAKPRLFVAVADEVLRSYGVPEEWLADVRAATDETILELADHLPAEAAEALLELATGGRPEPRRPAQAPEPFEHPDALRRFRVVEDVEELERALDAPWDKWTVFLHPAQRELVERHFNGPARVAGSAGTGKTIVALHRAVFLARTNPDSRVLLTTFSETLANLLRVKVRRLIGNEPRMGERLDVLSMEAVGRRLYEAQFGPPRLAGRAEVEAIIREGAAGIAPMRFAPSFLVSEWDHVVDAWQLGDWESYRDVARLGRKTRLPEQQRAMLWTIFARIRNRLSEEGLTTPASMFHRLATAMSGSLNPPYDFAVVDEAQDISVAQLRFLAALGGNRPDSLFFAGDLGQRIFQQPFSWKALGVDVRGRSRTLRVNYRTSHQIRTQADRLLGPEVSDIDGNVEDRRGTVSVFNGPEPTIVSYPSIGEEAVGVAESLRQWESDGLHPHEIAVFVRSEAELARALGAVESAGMNATVLDERLSITAGKVSVATMHMAKGLEFRAVIVMACDDDVTPSQERIETVGDEAELEDVYNTERQLLYVACTRARDHLLVTSGGDSSEFLDDLHG
jgi:hypothetical protein